MLQVRTNTIEIHPGRQTTKRLLEMMRSSALLYNQLVEHLQYKQQAWKNAKDRYPDQNPWEVDPYCDIRRKGWADDLLKTLTTQQQSLYPHELVNKPAKQGKNKGKDRLVTATRKNAKPDYGIPAQSKGALARDFEANIQSCFTHRKQGNTKAKLPKRFKGLHSLFFTNQLVQRKADRLILGAKPYLISVRVPELTGVPIAGDIKITRSRSGRFYLHVLQKHDVEPNLELTEVAAVDFGQKRAMVLALKDGTTATMRGKDICALKRERDIRYRGIGRARARVYRGQLRQYLSPEEQQKALSDTRYGWRMIAQRRRDGIDGKGRCLVALGQAVAGQPLRKRSKRHYKINRAQRRSADYYRVRLKYANHTITRAAANWCIENKVGKVFVGNLRSLPKRRKKGDRRIKQVARNNIWEMPTQAKYLDEKLNIAGGEGTQEGSERFSSQTCPNCGRRHKPRSRVYFCNPRRGGCGWTGDRDAVGGCNFLSSELYGELGKIKPVLNRTLRIAPAIRQGLRMQTPSDLSQVKTECEPAEDSAKVHKPSGLQASGIATMLTEPKTDRNLLTERKTQASRGKRVLAKSETLDISDSLTPVGDSATTKTGDKPKQTDRSLKIQPENFIQLSLWDSA